MTPLKPQNILVIEDNIGDCAIVDELLKEQLHQPNITCANTFKKAVTSLTDTTTGFDVILLDLTLPDKSGEKLVSDILELAGNCPVIILTGSNNLHFSIASISKGVSDYLLKDELSSVVLYKSILYAIERKKYITQLAESEKKYSDLFQLSPQPMCLYETDTYKIIYVNQAAINQYGYSYSEFLNMTLLDLVPKIVVPAIMTHVENQNRQLNNTYTGEFKVYTKGGQLLDTQTFSTPLIIGNKKTTLVMTVDVTEKNLYEQKITRAIIQAQENERYEIGAELHDNVCQILTASHMSFKMLKNNLSNKDIVWYEQGAKYIQNATQEIRNLSHRLAPVFFEDTTLEEAIEGLINSIDIEQQYDIRLQFDDAFKQFPCKQEFQLTLYRILQEQFRNIVKYAHATIITVNGSITKDTLVLTITDNGVGFDAKRVKHGIGLANIKRRTEVFNGRFTIESSIGNGSTLSVEVPLAYVIKSQ
ncbi:PAS domain S-box protein [Parasediminibacterium paludis]|uniref:histidine kinase n=1 Tax=Parasediminibacterium paludis TaxID=908966 RepID=A0ABV8Q0W3_9BACT